MKHVHQSSGRAAHAPKLLVAIAELRSSSAAAERLGLTPSAEREALPRQPR